MATPHNTTVPVSSSTPSMASASAERHKLDARGVPNFAHPWLEMGRLEEREKWQKLAMDLMETSIAAELAYLRGTVTTILPGRLLDLKSTLNTKVEDAQSRISQLIAQYKRFFLEERWNEDPQSEVLHAHHQEALASQSLPTTAPTCHATCGDVYNNLGSTSEIVEVGDEE
ncbi:hypothetical protein GOP47_0026700 [Adiantum capillus-veneris]|nr:hypothetical protein GOP47_0026700 [Adiantum capillus-veneris]